MSHVTILYRKYGDHASGSVVSKNGGNEKEIIRILDEFLRRWCKKRCFGEHGMPIFFDVPVAVKGRRLICRLSAAFRRAGFEVSLKHT